MASTKVPRFSSEGLVLGRFFTWLKALPHGADPDQDRAEARFGVRAGLLLAALGGGLFAAGWKLKVPWLCDSAFVVTLIGWMALVISGAFWLVLTLSKHFPKKKPGS